MTISIENQILLLQANFIPDEMEERTEPWPAWKLRAFWATALFGCLSILGGAIYCAVQAYQSLPSFAS